MKMITREQNPLKTGLHIRCRCFGGQNHRERLPAMHIQAGAYNPKMSVTHLPAKYTIKNFVYPITLCQRWMESARMNLLFQWPRAWQIYTASGTRRQHGN